MKWFSLNKELAMDLGTANTIIISDDNSIRYIPVKGAVSGVIDYLALYMAEHKIQSK